MLVGTLQTWITRQLTVRRRLERMCTSSLLVLMVATTKPAFKEASRFAKLPPSLLSKLLPSHANGATTTLENLSKTQVRQFAKALQRVQGLPWKIGILMDATRQPRASVQPENRQTFHHGKGDGIGHQWTNVGLVLGALLMPLKPIPFSRKRDCLAHELAYQSEQERVVASLGALDLEDSLGPYDRRAVLVFAASGYDHKKIDNAIADKGWNGISARSKTRSVKSEARSLSTPTSRQWCHIDTFFRRPRRLTWDTMRLATSGNKRQRMDLRVRHTAGSLRYVGQVELVCSERRNRPEGRRKYLACTDLRATARQRVSADRMRWAVELFPKSVKQHLGFAEVATQGFDAVMSHVHWVYCASILLHMSPPGLSLGSQSIGDKQRALQQGLAEKEKRQMLQKLSQIGGVQRYQDELRQALVAA